MKYQGKNSAFSTMLCPKDTNKSCSVTGVYLRILEFSSIVVVYASVFKCKTEMTGLTNSYSCYNRKSLFISSLNCHIEKVPSFLCSDRSYKEKSQCIC